MIGKVRVLSPDTPGIPPHTTFDEALIPGYVGHCEADITGVEVPGVYVDPDIVTYHCTRPAGHPEDEPHACHLRWYSRDEVSHVIVWGGE